jgi:hypothetical protein
MNNRRLATFALWASIGGLVATQVWPAQFSTLVFVSSIGLAGSVIYLIASGPKLDETPLEDLDGTASVEIARGPAEVWTELRRPEFELKLDDRVERSEHVPGTPMGVGAQRLVILQEADGSRRSILTELTAETQGRHLAFKSLDNTVPTTSSFDLEPIAGGTALTLTVNYRIQKWMLPYVPTPEAFAVEYLANVKRAIEAGGNESR